MLDLTWRLLREKTHRRFARSAASAVVRTEHAEQLRLMRFSLDEARGWEATFSSSGPDSAVGLLVAQLGDYFARHGGANFLELSMYHPDHGPLVLTIQRAHGKTPAQLKAEAEARVQFQVEAAHAMAEALEESRTKAQIKAAQLHNALYNLVVGCHNGDVRPHPSWAEAAELVAYSHDD